MGNFIYDVCQTKTKNLGKNLFPLRHIMHYKSENTFLKVLPNEINLEFMKQSTYVLRIIVRNMKMDFNTGGTWRRVWQ